MLQWKVCYIKDNYPYKAFHRRRRKVKDRTIGIILILAALLVLLLALPAWIIAVIICTVLIALGVLWILS